jgi:hypothetical protein
MKADSAKTGEDTRQQRSHGNASGAFQMHIYAG